MFNVHFAFVLIKSDFWMRHEKPCIMHCVLVMGRITKITGSSRYGYKGGFFSKVKVKSDHDSDEPPTFKKCFGQLLTKYTKFFNINAK